MADEQTSPKEDGIPYKIEYFRSALHRFVPTDGAWVGLNGHGKIILNFFSESPALPKLAIVETTPDGKKFTDKKAETRMETDAGAVRQFEISVTMSPVTAKLLFETLGNFIKLAEEQEKTKQGGDTK
jgi:hypothetical protein